MFIQAMAQGPSVFHRGRSTPEWVARDGSWRAIVLGIAGFLAGLLAPASGLGQTVVVEGIVTDSTRVSEEGIAAPQPLAGSRVWARGVGGQAEADGSGRFRLELPEPGIYELTFHHPRLDTIGVEAAGWREVEVGAGGLRGIELAAPSWRTLYALWCGWDPEEPGAEGIVAGRVRSTLDGAPIEGIGARLRPAPGTGAGPALDARSGDDGLILFCGVAPEVRYRLRVDPFGLNPVDQEVQVAAGGIQEAEFELEVGGHGTLRGRVREGEAGRAVAGAMIELRGPETRSALSDAEGRFTAEELPAGRYTVQVTHVAFRDVRREVAIPGGDRVVDVEVRLLQDAVALEPIVVEVEGRRPTWGPLVDVYERMDWMRKLGLGRIYDREEIENSQAMRLSHLLRRMAGVRSHPIPGSPNLIIHLNQNACPPSLYIDGVRLGGQIDDVLPMQAEVVEVYRRISQLPGEFWDYNSVRCGAVAIWTRRGH